MDTRRESSKYRLVVKVQAKVRGWLVRRWLARVLAQPSTPEAILMKRNRVLREFLNTEISYVERLTTICEVHLNDRWTS